MANTRQILKPYMGYSITKVNGYRYFATNGTTRFESNDLKQLKVRIKQCGNGGSWKEAAV